MSVGAGTTPEHPELGPQVVADFLADKRVQARLKLRYHIDRSCDIPYLAGYSRDGKIIYIDRHLLAHLKIGKQRVWVIPFLCTHEHVEKTAIDVCGMHYLPAHMLALSLEHQQLLVAGINGDAYENVLKPYIKQDALELVTRVPDDLDLTAYIESEDAKVLKHIQSVMSPRAWQQALNFHDEALPQLLAA